MVCGGVAFHLLGGGLRPPFLFARFGRVVVGAWYGVCYEQEQCDG